MSEAFRELLFALGGVILMLSFFAKGGAAQAGWTAYPPLSVKAVGNGQDLWILSLHILSVSSLVGAAIAVTLGFLSDRIHDRRLLVIACGLVGAVGYGVVYLLRDP